VAILTRHRDRGPQNAFPALAGAVAGKRVIELRRFPRVEDARLNVCTSFAACRAGRVKVRLNEDIFCVSTRSSLSTE